MLSSLFSENEPEQALPAQSTSNDVGQDVLAQAVQAANLQVEPKKPAQRRRKSIPLKGIDQEHDDHCREPLKCTLRWEVAKIQRKRTYDRQNQEIRTLKRKLGELAIENNSWKKKFSDITEENIRLNALMFVHRNQASQNQS